MSALYQRAQHRPRPHKVLLPYVGVKVGGSQYLG